MLDIFIKKHVRLKTVQCGNFFACLPDVTIFDSGVRIWQYMAVTSTFCSSLRERKIGEKNLEIAL